MMTWEQFLASDLTIDEFIEPMVEEAVAKLNVRVDAMLDDIRADTAEAERGIAEKEFERLVRKNAVLGGVLPQAVDYIVPDVRKLFEVRDNALKVRNGATMPGDPLAPLTIEAWLAERRKEVPFLFKES
jgi:hypothetical protein